MSATPAIGKARDVAIPHCTALAQRDALLRRALSQLAQWQVKYGANDCAWLPPAGDVRLAEDISQLLTEATKGLLP